MLGVTESGTHSNITASGSVRAGHAQMLGIFVAAASATPTIKVWDSLDASGTVVVGTFTPTAGVFYPIPALIRNGIFITISGTVDCTAFYST